MGIGSRFAAKAAAKAAKEAAAKAAAKAAKLAVTPKAKPRQLALPAPPKQLALPAPGPGLPRFAAKPRGGQFWADKEITYGNNSPEAAARFGASPLALEQWVPEAEGVLGYVDRQASPAQQWLERALTKYYKNDFGSPEDPLRDLAERGLHYDPEMTPERWQKTVNDYLTEDSLQGVLFPPNRAGGMSGAGDDLRGQTMAAMPWLAKVPATDKLYGISTGGLDLGHFTDEFLNALGDPGASGLPMDFAIRPESLGRMTFPQAVEQVGKINQFRAKEMQRAALSAQENPVTQTFKTYAEDNPMGLSWVEMAPPKGDGPTNYDVEDELRKALKYEGDTMGHCVGGYCPDVMSGKSRIFSLRDAKGEPHVTIETRPGRQDRAYSDAIAQLRGTEYWPAWLENQRTRQDNPGSTQDLIDYMNEFRTSQGLEPVGMDIPNDIVQIKGKQNRAPKDDYLPFVQDFVKSQPWSNVGDIRNTGLVKLPDGRYITGQQAEEIISAIPETTEMVRAFASRDMVPMRRVYDPTGLDRLDPEEWQAISQHFEGYAIGGRVSADRCFSKGKSAVYAVNKSRK